MAPTSFTLDDLCSLTDFSKRTVRYYMQLGLVDRPIGETRAAHYLEAHLQQLLRIKKLTDAGVSLERVRDVLTGATGGIRLDLPVNQQMLSEWVNAGLLSPENRDALLALAQQGDPVTMTQVEIALKG